MLLIKNETKEYILGERNATRDEFILSRECSGSAEFVSVSLPENPEPIYILWTKKPSKANKNQATGEISTPKHIGGKRPYIMLMQDQSNIINALSFNAAGLLMKLLSGGFIAWNTGQLIDRRSKKPLTINDIHKRYKLSIPAIKAIMKELTDNELIKYNRSQRAYILNDRFARKGGAKHED